VRTLQELYGEGVEAAAAALCTVPQLSIKASPRAKSKQAGVCLPPESREFSPPLCYTCMTLQFEQEVGKREWLKRSCS
jgi:hypothetical protein